MKKKLPMAPVRANVRGTCAVHVTSIVAESPGITGCGSGAESTVSSSALSSSGVTKRREAVRSARSGLLPMLASVTAETSRLPQSPADGEGPRKVRARSRMNVDRAFFHAFQ